ncbi:serine protease inhibitor dipetalogastin-like [Palaemon carinicauda]|uniref:serine protease inhibitor dipetalogastin-like n=1 Tax=Palaemon carinicauda TaxID=392227 RepID=UPI0035B5DB9A
MNKRTKLAPLLLIMVATVQTQRVGFSGNTCPDSCPDFIRPVCGTDNRAYRNDCYLQRTACNSDIRKKNDGPCAADRETRDCDRSCPTSYQPFCATNGRTYDNKCKLSIATCLDPAVKERYEGVCPAEPVNNGPVARPSSQTSSSSSSGSSSASSSGARPSGTNVLIGQPVRPVVETLSNPRPEAPAQVVSPAQPSGNCNENCTPGFRPVCGSDNQVYGNECLLQVAICKNPSLRKQNDGVCPKDCNIVCPLEINYVCGSNRRTYVNDCELIVAQCKDPAIQKVGNGQCDGFRNVECTIQNCERIANPVCGSDGRTYENMCLLRNRACVDSSLLRLHDGECVSQRCGQTCPEIAAPVCGSDGITYPNHCFLINEACRGRSNVVRVANGPCRS